MTIASLWRIERQNKNAQEIARQAGTIYDKFVGFVDDVQEIGDKLARTHSAYDNAMNKLSTGRGNLVGGIEKLKSLGAKTTKSLPKEMVVLE
jgi:DNA recombination protein RmuC